MTSLPYALDERRPPLPTYTAADGFVRHWAGHPMDRAACMLTLSEHLAKANGLGVSADGRATARRAADQLTAAMKTAFQKD
jgi:hypothetical protein